MSDTEGGTPEAHPWQDDAVTVLPEIAEFMVASLVKEERPWQLLEMFADLQLVPVRYAQRRLRASIEDLNLHVLGALTRAFKAAEKKHGRDGQHFYIWLPDYNAWAISYSTRWTLRTALGWGEED